MNKSIFINLLLIFLVILNPFSLSAQQLKVVKGEMCNTTSINAKIVESLNNEIYVAGYNALHEKIIFEKLNSNSSQIIAKSPKISTNSVVSYKDFRANESIIKFEDKVLLMAAPILGRGELKAFLYDSQGVIEKEVLLVENRFREQPITYTRLYDLIIDKEKKKIFVARILSDFDKHDFFIETYDFSLNLIKKSNYNLSIDPNTAVINDFIIKSESEFVVMMSDFNGHYRGGKNTKVILISGPEFKKVDFSGIDGKTFYLDLNFDKERNEITASGIVYQNERRDPIGNVFAVYDLNRNKVTLEEIFEWDDETKCLATSITRKKGCYMRELELRWLKTLKDGYLFLYEERSNGYGAIIIQKVDFSGNLIFRKVIRKSQGFSFFTDPDFATFNSFFHLLKDDKLVLVFNDNKKNYLNDSKKLLRAEPTINGIKNIVVISVEVSLSDGSMENKILLENEVKVPKLANFWGITAQSNHRVSDSEVNAIIRYNRRAIRPVKLLLE